MDGEAAAREQAGDTPQPGTLPARVLAVDTDAEYRRLVEELPLITYHERGGPDLPTNYISPQIEGILGYPAAEIIGPGDRFYELVHPDDRERTRAHTLRALAGEVVESEYRMRAADGGWVWFLDRSIPRFDQDGAVTTVRGFLLDITERKRVELERQAAAEDFRGFIEGLPGVVYWDAPDEFGSTIYLSPQVEAMYGYPLERWLSSPSFFIDCVLHPDDREAVLHSIAANNAGERDRSEYRCLHADGRLLWIYDDSVPQFDAEGTVVATRGFMVDITERKLAEEELRLREERVRQGQRMEAVGRLAGGIAHDFNNLLTVITGHVDLLAAATDLSPSARDELLQIGSAAERAASLTRQLLAYSRQQVLRPAIVDLGEVVAHVTRMLRRLLEERIELQVTAEPGLWPVRVDAGQVEQVLLNLVVNARDAIPAGGTIRIETRNMPVAEGAYDDVPAGDHVAVTVADTGIGFDDDLRGHIFEPFFTTKPVGEGTGLGLSTVQGIVDQSGGWVLVESTPGRGTRFTVLFPRVEGLPSAPTELAAEVVSADVASILLVEDDPRVRALVRATLERAGHDVTEAEDAMAALRAAAAGGQPIDLLLSDVVMRGMSGGELAEQLREAQPDLRVLLMSGYADDEALRHGLPAAAHFLHKPFLPRELLARVHELLAGQAS